MRDVVLYHLNFDFTGFNQMAGRAGRDGLPARIHLLYGDGDRRINDYIIAHVAPTIAMLREVYRGMRGLAAGDTLRMTFEDTARTLEFDMVDRETISTAVRIFAEAGLVEAGTDDDGRFVRFLDIATKVDLTQTTRFAEGQAERDAFDRFCGLALSAEQASSRIPGRYATVEPDGERACIVTTRGSWSREFLVWTAMLDAPIEVIGPPELVDAARALVSRLSGATGTAGATA